MIRLAAEAEAVDIFMQPRVIARIRKHTERFICQPWMVERDGYRMMFLFWEVGPATYEMHIATIQDRAHILRSRELAIEAILWLFGLGAEKIVTDAPEGKIANMARKLQFREYHREGDKIYFELRRLWVVQ